MLSRYWHLLVSYLRQQTKKVAMLALLLLASIALELAGPQILRSFIDNAIAGAAAQTLSWAAVLFIGVALLNQACTIGTGYLSEDVGLRATNKLRRDLTAHCLQLDMSFHNIHTPGEMIERIDGDISALANFFSEFVIRLIGSTILLLGIVIVLSRERLVVGIILGIFIIITFAAAWYLQRVSSGNIVAERQATADVYGFLEERLSGIKDIHTSGAHHQVMANFYRLSRNFHKKYLRGQVAFSGTLDIVSTLFFLSKVAAIAAGVYLFQTGGLTIGTVILIYSYTDMLERPMSQIMEQVGEFQKAVASIARIDELYHLQSAIQDGSGSTLSERELSVEFQGVSFEYVKEEQVLKNVSFALEPGKVLGILGRTGSGKTTLSRLLFRLYDPDAGTIRLAGQDIRQVALADLATHVCIVTQDVQLFHASVRDNLTFFDDSIADEGILSVLKELGLWAWYQTLPAGLDSPLTANTGLSSGEAQLLAFARIFLKDPGLVVLDEASSRLDPATEQLIEGAIHRLFHKRTGIIIAHRLSTISHVDEILLLEQGTVVEYGSREQLARDPATRFYSLMQTGIEEILA